MRGGRAWMGRLTGPADRASRLGEAVDWLGVGQMLRGARVFVKPNLTYRVPTPGVPTSPAFIEAVVARFADWTGRITVGEAEGGYHAFKAQEAFAAHGLDDLLRRRGAAVVNLSEVEAGRFTVRVGGHEVAGVAALPRRGCGRVRHAACPQGPPHDGRQSGLQEPVGLPARDDAPPRSSGIRSEDSGDGRVAETAPGSI